MSKTAISSSSFGQRIHAEWFSNVRRDSIAALTVSLALIPEAIAFSIIAGVDPKVGLYASFIIAVTTAFLGGRPGMISAATGAMALLMGTLVAQYGMEYLFAATILTGLLQLLFRLLRLSRYMKFVPRPVMKGFVNALAILIFMAQFPQFEGATWVMYAFVGAGLLIIYGLPRLTRAVPSPLVAILVLGGIALWTGVDVRTVGDMGSLPSAFPAFHIPMVPLTLETLRIIAPYAFALAMVGLIESLLTASIVDEMTDTPSCKHKEARGQGIANIITGFFGGMAGCAMIGQSVINVQSGGRTRLSTLLAGVYLIFLVLVLGDWVAKIPMGALVAVMFAVALSTFDWGSLREMKRMPMPENVVMLATVATVVATSDLALGVFVGIVLSAIFFARRVEKLAKITPTRSREGLRVYLVTGELFFVSVETFLQSFDYGEQAECVEIDLEHAHVWDASAVGAIEKVVQKFGERGVSVRLRGMNEESAALLARLGALTQVEGSASP